MRKARDDRVSAETERSLVRLRQRGFMPRVFYSWLVIFKTTYYIKSFEDDFILKTLIGKKKVKAQSIDDILKIKKIKTNKKRF